LSNGAFKPMPSFTAASTSQSTSFQQQVKPSNAFGDFTSATTQPSQMPMMGGGGMQQSMNQQQFGMQQNPLQQTPIITSKPASFDPFSNLVSLDVKSLSSPNKPTIGPGPSMNAIRSSPAPSPTTGGFSSFGDSNSLI
jgi:hypothetical protein